MIRLRTIQVFDSIFGTPLWISRIAPLDGLRAFATFLVFGVHFDALFADRISPDSWLHWLVRFHGSLGHTGVDLFFVISGFLIYGSVLTSRRSFIRYLHLRVKRLYPAFAVVFAIYLAVCLVIPSQSKLPASREASFWYVLANMLMLPGVFSIQPLITVAWSLSYEWFFYLVLPFLAIVLKLRTWVWQRRVAFFATISVLYALTVRAGLAHNGRLIMFGAGIILWELSSHSDLTRRLTRSGEILAVTALAANLILLGLSRNRLGPTPLVLTNVATWYSPTLFVSMFLFTLWAVFFDGWLKKLFSSRPIRWIGNISYSYYLIHGATLKVIKMALYQILPPGPQPAIFIIPFYVSCAALTLAAGATLFVLVEKPFSINTKPVVLPAGGQIAGPIVKVEAEAAGGN